MAGVKTYTQKDLGYPRDTTDAFVRVEMPDGSWWKFPAQIVADSRDENYVEDQEDTIKEIREKSLDAYDFWDWLGNNMNWEDVSDYAEKIERPTVKVDFQKGWNSGEKKLIGKL